MKTLKPNKNRWDINTWPAFEDLAKIFQTMGTCRASDS
jgi:hypothetical protein